MTERGPEETGLEPGRAAKLRDDVVSYPARISLRRVVFRERVSHGLARRHCEVNALTGDGIDQSRGVADHAPSPSSKFELLQTLASERGDGPRVGLQARPLGEAGRFHPGGGA